MGKLTVMQVKSLKEAGRYSDGDGLMLDVGKSGSRSWIVRVQHEGKRRDIGLGSARDVGLAQARTAAAAVREKVRAGLDPTAKPVEAPTIPTFKEAALQVIEEHKPSWKNAKHAAQWTATLEQYVFPTLGALPVDQITGPQVRDVLSRIWLKIPETARRVRQRVGAVLDWAHAKGYRPHELTMRSITKGLPRQPKGQEHFSALPGQEVPSFLVKLQETDKAGTMVKLLFRFLVLTAVRSGEARGARWSEIDFDAKLWTIPKERMKAGKTHVVPLSAPALAVLEEARKLRSNDDDAALVFPGERTGKPMSDMTLTMVLRRMGAGCTAHGFRSSFRDWAAEETNFPREVAEAALAHAVKDRVEAAYRRSDLLEKRRKLMDEWAAFCAG
ncbi:tyrosine-type recombinase/integrase [Azospirillum sp. sgz301742]